MRKTCCDVRYKLILTDIMMPTMDGIEEAQAIFELEKELAKDMPNLPKIRIVAVTAGENEEVINQCLNAGMEDVLFKPVQINELHECIQKHYKIGHA